MESEAKSDGLTVRTLLPVADTRFSAGYEAAARAARPAFSVIAWLRPGNHRQVNRIRGLSGYAVKPSLK